MVSLYTVCPAVDVEVSSSRPSACEVGTKLHYTLKRKPENYYDDSTSVTALFLQHYYYSNTTKTLLDWHAKTVIVIPLWNYSMTPIVILTFGPELAEP